MKLFIAWLTLLLLMVVAGVVFVTSGVYDIGADRPHWALTEKVIATLRDRSIAHQSSRVVVPDLDDPARIRSGAHHYAEMCAACHLTPGMRETELREGLYPQPPDLSQHGVHDPAEAFWVIKHGIKMTAMPAWGRSHNDEAIWAMVAFVRHLPGMDEAQFEALAGMPGNDGHGGGHAHEHGDHDHDEHDGDHHDHAGHADHDDDAMPMPPAAASTAAGH